MIAPSAALPSTWEDSFLIRRLRAGSADALARIYEKHRHYLLRVAAGLLADPSLAEDIVQDIFLRLARTPETIRGGGSLRGFLCTCVANHARNIARARRVRSETTTNPDQLPGDDAGPDGWLLRNDRLIALAEALARLPLEQREAVVLHLHGGLKFHEIAATTGTSVNTVQSRYRYGLEKLREHLKGDF